MKIYERNSSDQSGPFDEVEDPQVYKDILFNMLIPSKDFSEVECMNDFVELVQVNIMKIIDLEKSMPGQSKNAGKKKKVFEILFIEKAQETESLLIHAKDKCSLDLENKELVIFLLE
jgi:hypothetical protein